MISELYDCNLPGLATSERQGVGGNVFGGIVADGLLKVFGEERVSKPSTSDTAESQLWSAP